LDPVLDQFSHHRSDFGLEQDQVAHNHGAPMSRLERCPTAERECRFDGDAVERHLQIRARKSVAMNVAGYGSASSRGFVYLFPVDVLGMDRSTDHRDRADREHVSSTHLIILLDSVGWYCALTPVVLPAERTNVPHCSSE